MPTPYFSIKQLFLIDACGAVLTVLLSGLILPRLEHITGIPATILYPLSALAVVYGVYSWTCYLNTKWHKRSLLQIIATANLLYAALLSGLIIYYYSELTLAGTTYFILEATVIMALTLVELKVSGTV